MKKLFTLLFAIVSVTSVFAQSDYNKNRSGRDDNNNGSYSKPGNAPEANDRKNENRDYSYSDRRYNESYAMNNRELDFRIQKINREYDYKIYSVSTDRYLRPREKRYQIRDLENQRYDEIRNIRARFNNSRDRYSEGHSNRW